MQTTYLFLAVMSILVTSCGSQNDQSLAVYQSGDIKVFPKRTTATYHNASLSLLTPDSAIKPGRNNFQYKVNAYSLQEQTLETGGNQLANSGKGQHIHFIVDNQPYVAQYNPDFEAELTSGNHLVLAFLSRSFHESVKQNNAYVLKQYQLGDHPKTVDIDHAPMLFYSRPKGVYTKSDGRQVLLDFYLINTTLNQDGHQVEVHLDGHSFTVDEWQPYIIEGLTAGTHQIRIMLIDEKGEPVPGPFNDSGNRTFTIE